MGMTIRRNPSRVEIRGDNGTKRYPPSFTDAQAIAAYNGVAVETKTETVTPEESSVVVEEIPTVKGNLTVQKYTKEELVSKNKQELIEIAKELGIAKIGEKYLQACKSADIEDEILAKQGE